MVKQITYIALETRQLQIVSAEKSKVCEITVQQVVWYLYNCINMKVTIFDIRSQGATDHCRSAADVDAENRLIPTEACTITLFGGKLPILYLANILLLLFGQRCCALSPQAVQTIANVYPFCDEGTAYEGIGRGHRKHEKRIILRRYVHFQLIFLSNAILYNIIIINFIFILFWFIHKQYIYIYIVPGPGIVFPA